MNRDSGRWQCRPVSEANKMAACFGLLASPDTHRDFARPRADVGVLIEPLSRHAWDFWSWSHRWRMAMLACTT